ncbi:Asp domain-containing protein [Rhizoctonia solani AG-1 IA]|uniref:Asp domain-containing protein n=1 Tax=Thanatephorus cucumeris (strain AG1-IA) TaxID=983506 RepID=L8WFT8_THACA|nr:Asp domain-containing protein [Rhizoctonia solani AG-1 IA]
MTRPSRDCTLRSKGQHMMRTKARIWSYRSKMHSKSFEYEGGYIFPTKSDIPHLAFCVGRWLFTMPGYELSFSEMGNGMSYGAVQSRGQNRQDILGDVWLKHVYVVFEQSEKPRVGVAQRS